MQLQSRGNYLQFDDALLYPKDDINMILTSDKVSFQSISTKSEVIKGPYLYTDIVKAGVMGNVTDLDDFLTYISTL